MKALEFIPLIAFFITYKIYGLLYATAAIVITSIVVMFVTMVWTKQRPSNFVLMSTSFMIIMGLLTLITADTTFIKMKPTVLYSLCASVTAVGLLYKKVFIKKLFSNVLDLSEKQWYAFSIQWILFFVVAAFSNEIIWRFCQEEHWINFKVMVMPIVMLLFTFAQIFFYRKHLVIEK